MAASALTPEEVTALLGLQPLVPEGGAFRQTYLSGWRPLGKPGGTAIYYLLTADSFSHIHRLPGDEMFHFYLGDPLEICQLPPDPSRAGTIVLGPDLRQGQRPQVLIPAGVWQGSRLRPGGRWALIGTTMWPGFDPATYEQGDREALLAQYPAQADLVTALTNP